MKLDTFLYIIGLVALAISAILAWFWIYAEDGIKIGNDYSHLLGLIKSIDMLVLS